MPPWARVGSRIMSTSCSGSGQPIASATSFGEIKKASSRWVHHEIGLDSFRWQESYAAFTVDWRGVPIVKRYIADQEQHHRKRSFREELVAALDEAGIEYDPQYLD